MDASNRVPPLRTALSGFRLPGEALGLLWRERSLWLLAVVPVLLSLAAFATAVALLAAYAGEIHDWSTAWLPDWQAARWWEWIWVGPGKLLLSAVGALLFLAVAGAALVTAYVLASLLASPFHDALAARVEQIVTGVVADAGGEGIGALLREGGRALREELRRTAFFLSVTIPLVLAGALLPGVQLITGPVLMAFTIFFLPLDYASYALDRRHVSFREKRARLGARRAAALGFGSAAFLTCLVPGLNFFAMPILVVAGTLFALRLGNPEDQPG